MDVRRILEYALQREHEGKAFFEQHAGRFAHAAVRGAFERLTTEEQKHIAYIERLIESLDTGVEGTPSAGEALQGEAFFTQRTESEMINETVIESMVPDLPVLRMAYLIERDFAEFYEMASRHVSEAGARSSLEMLARWERGHEALFKELHDRAFEAYAGMPWGG